MVGFDVATPASAALEWPNRGTVLAESPFCAYDRGSRSFAYQFGVMALSEPQSEMHSLRFFGTARVEDSTRSGGERLSQPRALALLACLSATGANGCTRDKLVGLLWPELDSRHARHALSVQLHQIRRALGREALITAGELVRLNPGIVTADVLEFNEAFTAGDLPRAAELYGGPFLEGFHLTGCPEFERWIEDQRQRLAVQCLDVLESLAGRAEREGAAADAVAWWQCAAQHDPFNSRVALACARALAAAGDRGNGVQFLREHAKRLREELEIEPDPTILDAIRTGDFGVAPDYTNGGTRTFETLPSARTTAQPSARASAEHDAGQDRALPPTQNRRRAFRRRHVVVGAAATVLALAGTMAVRARIAGSYDPGRIAILPTQTVGLDTTVSALATAHLHAAVAAWDGLEAASATATNALWRSTGGTATSSPADARVRSIAADVGAGLLLTSNAAPVSGGSIELHARLSDATDGTLIASASLEGPADRLRETAALVLFQLVGRTQGLGEDRIAILGSFRPTAVQRYLEAHRVGAAERERLLREALDHDTTFALAALELLEASPDYYNQQTGDAWEFIAAAAWRHRERLSPADRAYVEALVGWRFLPNYSAAQHVDAWERAVEIAPDRLLNRRGYALACYRWCSELNAGWTGRWTTRALEAHDALLDAGDSDPDFLERGLEVAVLAADRVRMRRYAELLPADALYGRWLAAWGLESRSDAAELRRLIEEGEINDLRVGNVAVLTGLGLEDAEILARRDKNSGRIHQLRALVQARERGHHAEYRALREKIFQLGHTTAKYDVFLSHEVVWDWAYFDEPETDSVLERHDRTLAEVVGRQSTVGPDTLATAYCALAQLRLGREDTTGVTEAIEFLSNDPAARDLAVSRMCAPFLELLAARGRGHDVVTQAARRLNEVVAARPLDLGTGDAMINVEIMLAGAANLVLARTYLSLGFPEAGLRAAVRRPYRAGLWGLFGYHVDFLLEEARLLAAAGTTGAALEKYDLYFRLRPDPPDLASWRETWNAAQAERKALRAAAEG